MEIRGAYHIGAWNIMPLIKVLHEVTGEIKPVSIA